MAQSGDLHYIFFHQENNLIVMATFCQAFKQGSLNTYPVFALLSTIPCLITYFSNINTHNDQQHTKNSPWLSQRLKRLAVSLGWSHTNQHETPQMKTTPRERNHRQPIFLSSSSERKDEFHALQIIQDLDFQQNLDDFKTVQSQLIISPRYGQTSTQSSIYSDEEFSDVEDI